MSRTRVERNFGRLTNDERFRLMLAAAARQDTAEVIRLSQTCPRRSYTQNDLGYTEKVRASRRVAMLWALLWERAYRDLLICAALTSRSEEHGLIGAGETASDTNRGHGHRSDHPDAGEPRRGQQRVPIRAEPDENGSNDGHDPDQQLNLSAVARLLGVSTPRTNDTVRPWRCSPVRNRR